MDYLAKVFSKKFPEFLDHVENDKPVLTVAGCVVFCFL